MSDAQELTPNQVRGYKATLSNDRVSDEAKAHAQEMLDGTDVSAKMDDNGPTGVSAMEDSSNTADLAEKTDMSQGEQNRVAGGFKAALHNDNTSEEKKENARVQLEKMGQSVDE